MGCVAAAAAAVGVAAALAAAAPAVDAACRVWPVLGHAATAVIALQHRHVAVVCVVVWAWHVCGGVTGGLEITDLKTDCHAVSGHAMHTPCTHQAHTRHMPGTCQAGTHHAHMWQAHAMHTLAMHTPC